MAAKKKAAKKKTAKRKTARAAAKRELIAPRGSALCAPRRQGLHQGKRRCRPLAGRGSPAQGQDDRQARPGRPPRAAILSFIGLGVVVQASLGDGGELACAGHAAHIGRLGQPLVALPADAGEADRPSTFSTR